MIGSVSLKLCRWVLVLYPEPFRKEFEDEILRTFPECQAAQGFWYVLSDILFSAAKQRVQYQRSRAPKSAPLYSEVTWSPDLARILVAVVFGVALIVGALTGRGRSEARDFGTGPLRLMRTCDRGTIRAGYPVLFRGSANDK